MSIAGVILQVAGFIVFIGGSIYSLGLMSSPYNGTSPFVTFVAAIISGAILFGIGHSFVLLDDIAKDVRRSAVANERSLLANDRTAEALERLVSQRRKEAPKPGDPPRSGTVKSLPSP